MRSEIGLAGRASLMLRATVGIPIALLLSTSALRAQSNVSGVVLDSISGTPVAGAVVFGAEPGIQTVTDSVGQFSLGAVETPTSLFVSAFGYVRSTIEGVTTDPVTILLARGPVEIEGFEATARRFVEP